MDLEVVFSKGDDPGGPSFIGPLLRKDGQVWALAELLPLAGLDEEILPVFSESVIGRIQLDAIGGEDAENADPSKKLDRMIYGNAIELERSKAVSELYPGIEGFMEKDNKRRNQGIGRRRPGDLYENPA